MGKILQTRDGGKTRNRPKKTGKNDQCGPEKPSRSEATRLSYKMRIKKKKKNPIKKRADKQIFKVEGLSKKPKRNPGKVYPRVGGPLAWRGKGIGEEIPQGKQEGFPLGGLLNSEFGSIFGGESNGPGRVGRK